VGPITGSGAVTAESGAFENLAYTFASRTSAKSQLTDPEELLATAHAGCFAMSLASVLTEEKRPSSEISVSAEVTIAPTEVGRRITLSEITVEGVFADAVDEAWFSDAVARADDRCPFSALIRASGKVTVQASLR
jgi:osmotically inducible protein OsmC